MEVTQETNQLVQIVETSGLEKSKGLAITNALSQFFSKALEWNQTIETIVITDPSEVGKMKMAKEGRLYLKNLRLEGEKIVKAKREDIKARMADDVLEDKLWLKAGQMMEATFKNLETKLEEKEKFAERWEADRKAKLMSERISILAEYKEFVPFGIESSLGDIEATEFDKLLNGAKLQLEAKKEAERKAEEERILFEKKQAEERERIRLENERLKKEAEERDRIENEKKEIRDKRTKELRPYLVFIRDYTTLIEKQEEEYQKELDEVIKGAELQWEYERKENERLKKEAEERERITQERIAAEEAERKRQKEEFERKLAEESEKAEAEKKALEQRTKTGVARREMLLAIGMDLDFNSCADMQEVIWNELYEKTNNSYQAEQNKIFLEKLKAEAEARKQKAEQEANLKKEREERERILAELRAKQEAEDKARLEAEAKAEAELNKGDAEKFLSLMSDIEMLKYKYQFKSKKYQKLQASVNDLLEKIIVYSKDKTK